MKYEIGKTYRLHQIRQHDDCQACDNCVILSLMLRGMIPESEFRVERRLGGNVIIKIIDGSEWAIREQYLQQCDCSEVNT